MIDTQVEPVPVPVRLRDLRDGVSYFRMSLNWDFDGEPGKLELPASRVNLRILEDARILADGLLRVVKELVRQAGRRSLPPEANLR